MISPNGTRLDTGVPFPPFDFALPGGNVLHAPNEFDHPYQVVLFYRGHWCPYCVSQLKSFQTGLDKLEDEGIGVIAASVDDEAHTADTIASNGLTFPVAHSLPIIETAQTIGAFYDAAPQHTSPFLHATGFVLGPDRRIMVAVYSSGAIGRLGWQDVLGMVRYAKSLPTA